MLGDEFAGAAGTKARGQSAFTFVSERGAPFTVAGLGKLIERTGVAAKIGFKVHMHTAKTIPPAVVAGALRSSAGANKHGVFGIYRPRCTVAPGISRPKHSPQQLASPA